MSSAIFPTPAAPPRVLVTGGAGFIGSHLVDRFLAEGSEVVVIDDLSTGRRANLPDEADCRVVDVASPEARDIIRDGRFDIIAHLAARIDIRESIVDPLGDAQANVLGAINIGEAVRSLPVGSRPRIIFASTGGALYGDLVPLPAGESDAPNPDSPYGISKLAAEYYLAYYRRVWGLDVTALRIGNVYGARQDPNGPNGVIANFALRILRNEPVVIYGDGNQTRDYVHVSDVIDAFLSAVDTSMGLPGGVESRAYNIGTGIETSVLDLANLIADVVGVVPTIEYRSARTGDVPRSRLDVDKAGDQLKWRATTELRDGLVQTVDWISAQPATMSISRDERRAPAGRSAI